MREHRYQVTLDYLSDKDGVAVSREPLSFEVGNHDDIFMIVEWMRGRGDFNENDATAFGVGLKLFSEVMLKNNPLFSSFMPHFMEFMKNLKKGPAEGGSGQSV